MSDRDLVGIFNTKTLLMSEENNRYFDKIKSGDKTVVIDKSDKIITTHVSSFTVINRTELKGDFVWRKMND